MHQLRLLLESHYLTTLETMQALEGSRLHMAHIQFHSYGGENWGGFCSKAAEIAEYINAHPNVTTDIGQVVFGDGHHQGTVTRDQGHLAAAGDPIDGPPRSAPGPRSPPASSFLSRMV